MRTRNASATWSAECVEPEDAALIEAASPFPGGQSLSLVFKPIFFLRCASASLAVVRFLRGGPTGRKFDRSAPNQKLSYNRIDIVFQYED
jgi:hypothetical protein